MHRREQQGLAFKKVDNVQWFGTAGAVLNRTKGRGGGLLTAAKFDFKASHQSLLTSHRQ